MPNYTAIAAKAQAKLASAGQAATLRRVTEGAYNPATGSTAAATTTDYSGYAVESLAALGAFFSDKSLVQSTDRFFLLNATSVDPIPGDKLIVGSLTLEVVNVKTVRPGGTSLLHKLHVRV